MTRHVVVEFEGKVVGQRSSADRVYTHAIVGTAKNGKPYGPYALGFASSFELAHKAANGEWARYGYTTHVIPVTVVAKRHK